MSLLHRALFYDQEFNSFFEIEPQIELLLEFESKLARAQALQDVIPQSAARLIEETCRYDNIDIDKLIKESALSGNVLIPLLKQCSILLTENKSDADRYIHLGATSQDAIDSASMMLYKKCGLWIKSRLRQLILDLMSMAQTHSLTPMVGRTFLQHAKPITFGFKIAGWLDGLIKSYEVIAGLTYPLQLGGAVGNWTGTDQDEYKKISESLALQLDLSNPGKPWHNQRQPVVEIAVALGMLSGHLSKIARDLTLMAQTEIGEVSFVSTGKGQSSSMPHKNNPVNSILIAANGQRIPPLISSIFDGMSTDHERAAGAWHAEWVTMEDILKLVAGSLRLSIEMINEIRIHPDRMLENINHTNGLIFAEAVSQELTLKIGKIKAQAILVKACADSASSGKSLKAVLSSEIEIQEYISYDALDALFSIENNQGLAEYLILEVLNKAKTMLTE